MNGAPEAFAVLAFCTFPVEKKEGFSRRASFDRSVARRAPVLEPDERGRILVGGNFVLCGELVRNELLEGPRRVRRIVCGESVRGRFDLLKLLDELLPFDSGL